MLATARKFLNHVLPGVIRPIHILWNQVIGFFFLVIGAIPIPSAIRSYRNGNVPHLALSAVFIVIMFSFGISSFLSARKISRS
jgi:hypothetical protein